MARPRAGKPLPGARPLPKRPESTADAVVVAESSRGRNMVSSPAATQKSERIFDLTNAAIANISQGGGTPGPPPPQNSRGCVRDGDGDAGMAQ